MTSVFRLSYNLGSIPSGTGRLDRQDVARGATNRTRGSEVQDLQTTGARASHTPSPTRGSWQARRNRRDTYPVPAPGRLPYARRPTLYPP
jgi:hypothetical protein